MLLKLMFNNHPHFENAHKAHQRCPNIITEYSQQIKKNEHVNFKLIVLRCLSVLLLRIPQTLNPSPPTPPVWSSVDACKTCRLIYPPAELPPPDTIININIECKLEMHIKYKYSLINIY